MSALTPNSMAKLAGNGPADPSFQPVVQIIDVRKVGGATSNNERYRVILSDGTHYLQGMLATQLNHVVHGDVVAKFCVARVTEHLTNLVGGKTVVIVLNVDVLSRPGSKFGEPVEYVPPDQQGQQQGAGGAQPMYGNAGGGGNNNPVHVVKPEQPRNMYGGGGGANQPPAQNRYGNNNNNNSGGYGSNNNNSYGGNSNNNNGYGNNTQTNSYGNKSSSPIQRSNAPQSNANFTPIDGLNMYQNRWTIKARVTNKGDIRTWSNAKGEGSLFSAELLDGSGTDIRCTFFKEAVDKFYNMLEVDKVYTLGGGRLKAANMQYNTCKSHLEITFDQNSEIHLAADDGDIRQGSFEFVPIANVEGVEPNAYVDILGVVKSVSPVASLVSKKTGKELFKSDLIVADASDAEINCTVWGDRAKTAESDFANQPIVAFKKLRVSDYGGRSVSVSGGAVLVNPRGLPQAEELQRWWGTVGRTGTTSRSLSSSTGSGRADSFEDRKTLSSIKDEGMGFNEKPDWFSVKASFNFIKKDKEGGPWYPACTNPEEPCKNRCKVTPTTDGYWHCDRCNQTKPDCVRRFIFSATITDDTCTSWVSLFDEQARMLLGGDHVTADDLYKKYFEDEASADPDGFDALFARATFTDWIIKCKVKQEMVGDESRVKTSVYSMQPMDYAKESRNLLGAIKALG